MIAAVLVDVKAKAVDKTFDYLVPTVYEDVIEVGQRVHVPFGPRFVMGYVLALKDDSDIPRLRPIKRIIDLVPSLTQELIDLGHTIKRASVSPLVSIYQAMLPAALKAKYQRILTPVPGASLADSVADLFTDTSEVVLTDDTPHLGAIKRAIEQGALQLDYRIRQRGSIRYKTLVSLSQDDAAVRGEKQQAILRHLKQYGATEKGALLGATKASYTTLRSLLDKGIVTETEEEVYRTLQHRYDHINKQVTLLPSQQAAYERVRQHHDRFKVFLLHGVTGSGKTELYLNVIEDVVQEGKQAILLVPEISLTPMMNARFKGRFGDNVALLHSRLSIGEKYDEWRKVRRGDVQVVVGARSAIFAPFTNLGVIIIDEEHTDSYKQDTEPRYHALDVARMRAEHYDIPLILGSATPSVDSFYRAQQGEYELLTLNERANDATLPMVHIEDMRTEFEAGNRSIFSRRLAKQIEDRLDKGEQTLLLLNRRGHSTFVMCRTCGEVIMCPNCDISLTYHEKGDKLKCHYCGHEEWSPAVCPSCGSPHIRYMGIGTEKVEEVVRERYPNARVIRMDADTTTTKNAHEELLYTFEHEGDILIGTQMIAKGLDFPNVTLVGVLAADMSLHLPDYQAIEHTFQLLTHVAGRAGRHDKAGEVVIQTYNPDHYAIRHAQHHDYHAFYQTETEIRRISGYTPFVHLTQIVLSDKDVKRVLKVGQTIVLALRKELPDDVVVLGPVLPKVARVNQYYRAQIILKHHTQDGIDLVLQAIYDRFAEDIVLAIDKHPSLL
jgi:primosomal protein N' (replication factor Y)